MQGESSWVPGSVRELADQLYKELGIEPDVARLKTNLWRITVRSKRVVVTIDFKGFNKGKKFLQEDSTLTIDGKPQKLARDIEHLKQFFKDPTGTLKARQVMMTVPPAVNPAEASADIRDAYLSVTRQAKKVPFQLSRSKKGDWVLGVYLEDRLFELTFVRHNGQVRGAIRLIIDGEDCSSDVKDIGQAILRLLSGTGVKPDYGKSAVKPRGQQAKRSTAVQVRNTVVIRN